MQKKEIVRFYMGNRFDSRQVNNFLVNQEVMSTCKNKFYFTPRDIKFRTILVRKTFSDECEFAARAEGE